MLFALPQCTCDGVEDREIVFDEVNDADELGMECNYQKDCTPLYKSIETEQWDVVATFLDTGYWPGTLFPDTMPPAVQAKTWVTRFEEDSEKVKWSQLPIHLAIVVSAPLGIIRRLLNHYPQAIRCTDDEHMLPFHLAMRHGAADEIVDYLLEKFPGAVNAKGKAGRSAIDCAMRSRKKARARILTTFLEQIATGEDGTVSWEMRSALTAKEHEINHLHSQLNAVEKARTVIEKDMSNRVNDLASTKSQLEHKIDELKRAMERIQGDSSKIIDEYETSKFYDELEAQKRIQDLEDSARELEAAEKKVREEEELLRSNLEKIELSVARSFNQEDLATLKKEVASLKSGRLQTSRERAIAEMEALKKSMEKTLNEADGKTRQEIKLMHQAITGLQSKNMNAKSNAELDKLRHDVNVIKEELKAKREVTRTKGDIMTLKRQLIDELKFLKGAEDTGLTELQKSIEALDSSKLHEKSRDDLDKVKEEVASLKKLMQERVLVTQAKRDMTDLKAVITAQLKETDDARWKRDLNHMKGRIEATEKKGIDGRSSEDLLDLKMKLVAMKDTLKEKEASSKMKVEVEVLKKDLEVAIKKADSKTKQELVSMRKPLDALEKSKSDADNFSQLLEIKKKIQSLTDQIVPKSEVQRTKEELALMKRMLGQQIKENDGQTKRATESMKVKVDALQSQKLETMNRSELDRFKAEMSLLWKRMAETEEILRTKAELSSLKKQLNEGISNSTGQNRTELLVVKKTVDGIKLDQLEIENQAGWTQLKKELEAVKLELKKRELRCIKRDLESELQYPEGKSEGELSEIRAACDLINVAAMETATISELNNLKDRVTAKIQRGAKAARKGKKKGFRGWLGRRSRKPEAKPDQAKTTNSQKVMTLLPPRVTEVEKGESSEADEESNSSEDKKRTTKYGAVNKVIESEPPKNGFIACAQ